MQNLIKHSSITLNYDWSHLIADPELKNFACLRQYSAGTIIINEGSSSSGLFLLKAGLVKICRFSEGGREHFLSLLSTGQLFNIAATLDGKSDAISAIADTDVSLWHIDSSAAKQLIQHNPDLLLALTTCLTQNYRQLIDKSVTLSTCSVKSRLAKYLLAQADSEYALPRRMTHEEIAHYLGTVREMISRTLRTFEKENLVQLSTLHITILDRKRLRQIAQQS